MCVWKRGIVKWRVDPGWYLAAIGFPAILSVLSGIASWAVGRPIDLAVFPPELLTLGIGIVLATVIGVGQKEIGWGGFAQPDLQQRYGAWVCAIAIGIIWGVWHLPLFVDPLAPHSQWPLVSQIAYFVGITGFSVLLALIYNGTGGSILLAMVMHGSKKRIGCPRAPRCRRHHPRRDGRV